MPTVEWRGNRCRVKWWGGEYLPSGKKKYEAQSGFTDEQTAFDFGLDREYEVRHGTHIPGSASREMMREYCWAWHKAQDLRPRSVQSYGTILRAQIIPYWGAKRVADISTIEYDAWKKALGEKQRRGELSESYVSSILTVFNMLMDDSVDRYGYRKASPVPKVKAKRGRYTKKKRAKKQPMEMGTIYQLAVNAYLVWGYTGWVYIWHAAFTGMRPGEMFGLRREFCWPDWPRSDPDKDRRRESIARYVAPNAMPALRVQYQHQWVDGAPTLTEPKYESHRTLVLPAFLAEMHERLAACHEEPWVFLSMNGRPMLGTRFDRDYWAPIRDGSDERSLRKDHARVAIPPVEVMDEKPIYRLRHTHKEWIDEDGAPRIAAEARMGHELAGVEGLYGNVTPKMERGIAEGLQSRWESFMGTGGGLWTPPVPNRLPLWDAP